MKISILVGSFPALSETFILNQITGFLANGHEVKIFSGARASDLVVHEDVIRHGLMTHVRFYNQKPRNKMLRVLAFLWQLPGFMLRAPRETLRSLNVFCYGRDALSLSLFFRMAAFWDARGDDVILCHFGQNGLVGARMKELGILHGRLITVFHASDISSYVWKEGRAVYARLFETGDAFLPVSRHARGKLIELGCPEKKIMVHRMGVDLEQFPLNVRKRLGTSPLRLLSVARLVEKKGIRVALEAVRMVMEDEVACEYMVIGDGPLRDELEKQALRLGIKGVVRFAGWQDSGFIRRALKDADFFLAPSLVGENRDEEGIPVVLMEAMACGVPVVTTPTGAIRELVADGKTGFLAQAGSSRSLADRLLAVWRHPEAAERVVRDARLLVEQEYNVETLNRILEKFFKAILMEAGTYEKRT